MIWYFVIGIIFGAINLHAIQRLYPKQFEKAPFWYILLFIGVIIVFWLPIIVVNFVKKLKGEYNV